MEPTQLDLTHHFILQTFVERGHAPHYSEIHEAVRKRMQPLAVRWIPPARIQHPWPTKRFGVTIQGKSPVR